MPLDRLLAFGCLACLGGLGASSRLSAQSATAELIPIPTRTVIGFNPLGLPADIGTIEIENAIAPGITVGGVGSAIDVDHDRFTTLEFKLRYYPGDVVLRGWSVGATGGVSRFSNLVDGTRQALTAPTLGIVVDYNWVLGRSQHFVLGTGVGAKRVLASNSDRTRADVDRAVGTVRFIAGVAF